ncbi:MAG: class I mannose-6-phosphate isomerase [Hyphomicrobiaceae bacterium]
MTIEIARARMVTKPWGVIDLRPWSRASGDGRSVGEIWYERPGQPATEPALLLKLLFTSQPLSIQVHPDDAYARSVGPPSGKTEAWYVLKAAAGAQVALGLKQQTTLLQLREAIGDGSIADLVAWQTVSAEDVVFVPAGTIHAVAADRFIAEIQQRSDTTFRLFDYGRKRELHLERAIAVAHARPPDDQERPMRYSDERILLVSNSHFVFDRIDLAANASWRLDAERETWLLVLNGSARAGSISIASGDAIFA